MLYQVVILSDVELSSLFWLCVGVGDTANYPNSKKAPTMPATVPIQSCALAPISIRALFPQAFVLENLLSVWRLSVDLLACSSFELANILVACV